MAQTQQGGPSPPPARDPLAISLTPLLNVTTYPREPGVPIASSWERPGFELMEHAEAKSKSRPFRLPSEVHQRWLWWERCGIVVAIGLFVFVVLFVLVYMIMITIERSETFQPCQHKCYRHLRGRWYTLCSGGRLVRLDESHANHGGGRRILFLHGSTKSLDIYAKPLMQLSNLGYDVWALEYGGYGAAPGDAQTMLFGPYPRGFLRDVYEAWTFCGTDDTILLGYSLGGSAMGEIYDCLSPPPAQLGFLNTFPSFPQLATHKLCDMPTLRRVVSAWIRNQWHTCAPRKFKGKVLVVYTADDKVVPPIYGKELCCIFECLEPDCVELPCGGHQHSLVQFSERWIPFLLPPTLVCAPSTPT